MTTVLHNSTTPSVSVTAASGNDQPQLVATIVPDHLWHPNRMTMMTKHGYCSMP